MTRSTHSDRTRWAASSASDAVTQRVGHDLHDAGTVTQVEERDPAVVAPVVDPAGDGDGLAGVLGTQVAAGGGAHGAVGGDAHVVARCSVGRADGAGRTRFSARGSPPR